MLWGAALLPIEGHAQTDRYELGLRVRASEAAWDAYPAAEARRRAVPKVQGAVMGFFSGQFASVGKALDEARFALRSERPPEPAEIWAASLSLFPETRLLDTSVASLSCTLRAFYATTEIPPQATLELRLMPLRDTTAPPALIFRQPIAALPLEAKLALRNVAEGDYMLQMRVRVGAKVMAQQERTLSFAMRLKSRLEALQAIPISMEDTHQATLASLTKLLTALADRRTFETDYPAARLLQEAEAVAEATRTGKRYYGAKRVGQFWLTLAHEKRATPVRLLAPRAVEEGQPLPLVIALHGAGGSENLFFDGYGRGKIVGLCAQRGWLLVAPRAQGGLGAVPLPDLIEAVNRLYPVDRKRVFLIGHSMGAMQAWNAVQRQPELFAGIAALSGGGFLKPSDALKKLPFFLGVGAQDFSLAMARQAQAELKKAEVTTLVYREYPECEHLFAVQVALPDVFAFLDKIAALPCPGTTR
jgi:predicted esterase